MQTLKLIHRLDLRFIGVSGCAIAKQASESKSDSDSKLGLNVEPNVERTTRRNNTI